jgi:hypothetical protein
MKTKKITPTALEQARMSFDKLVQLSKRRNPAKAQSAVDVFAVAVLPSGNLLMSNGQVKIPAAAKKVAQTTKQQVENVRQIGGRPQVQKVTEDLALQVAIPARHMGTGVNRAMALTNFLNSVLRPRMETQPTFGKTTLLPSPEAVGNFYTPSAIANLPPLMQKVENVMKMPMRQMFTEDTGAMQKQMMEEFLKKFMRGERPAANAAMGSLGATPRLTADYQNKQFYIPPTQELSYSAIKPQTPSVDKAFI